MQKSARTSQHQAVIISVQSDAMQINEKAGQPLSIRQQYSGVQKIKSVNLQKSAKNIIFKKKCVV